MTKKTILIADDDSELTQSLAMRLRRLGFAVVRYPDASHALVGTMRVPPDLIVLDVNMPNGNGLAVCEMLAGNEQCRDIPVIIHTGLSDPTTVARCTQLKARYLQKAPGSPEQIAEIACEVLKVDVDRTSETIGRDQETPAIGESIRSHVGSAKGGEAAHTETPATMASAVTTMLSGHTAGDRDPLTDISNAQRRPTVLSIDDDSDISKALQIQLEPHGLQVLRALSGEQGYAMAVEHRPDVIITDLVLPEAEGAYIVRRIRSNPSLRDIPVIVLTGQSYPAINHQILTLGVDAFLTKPVAIQQLLRELRNHIDLPATAGQPRATATANWAGGVLESTT